jgi:hypothetical protein
VKRPRMYVALFALSVILSLALFSRDSSAQLTAAGEWRDYAELVAPVGEPRTITWGTQTGITKWNVEVFSLERSTDIVRATVLQPSFAFTPRRAGHYRARVQACTPTQCSAWSDSRDPAYAVVSGQPRGWFIYAVLSTPGTPVPLP